MANATARLSALTEADAARIEFLTRYTGNTRTAYAADLAAWFAWCAEHQVDVLEVRRAHIELHAAQMTDRGLRPATVNRRLTTIATFYKLAHADGKIPADPARFVRRPKVPTESPTLGLSYLEFARFLEAAEQLGPTDQALAAMLGMLGLRCSEACSVDIEDLGEERGHRTLRLVGKGGKPAVIPLPVPVVRALDRAIGERTSGPVLVSGAGVRMCRSTVRRSVARICRRAGIVKHVSPHSLRHTFVTQLLDAGANLRDVQIAARHADPRMTLRYDRGRQQLDRHANYVLAARMAQ